MSAIREWSNIRRSMPPRVGLALLHWNSGDLTQKCLGSVMSGDTLPAAVVVFDNGSDDGAIGPLRDAFPAIHILRSESNLGFAGGANAAMRFLLDVGVDYIWLLNDDTLVDPKCLSCLVAAMEGHVELSACSARVVLMSDPSCAWYAGGYLDKWSGEGRHWLDGVSGDSDAVIPVDFLSGCCMLLRTSALKQIGLFDESFFAYGEDADWCHRAREHGARLGYVPSAVVEHAVSGSVRRATLGVSRGSASSFQQFLTFRSAAILARKRVANGWMRAAVLTKIVFRGVATMLGQIMLGRSEKVGAVLKGLQCGLFDPLDRQLNAKLVTRFTRRPRTPSGPR